MADKLALVPVTADHLEGYRELFSTEEVCRYMDIPVFRAEADAPAFLDKAQARARSRKTLRYTILVNQAFAGTICLYAIFWHQQRASLGYALLPRFAGRGIMGAALEAIKVIASDTWQLHRLQATVLPDNARSRNVLLRHGFAHEGLLRRYEIWEGRGPVDLELWSWTAPTCTDTQGPPTTIRRLSEADADLVERLWTDPGVRRHLGGPSTPRAAGAFRETMLDHPAERDHCFVALDALGHRLGIIMTGTHHDSQSPEISYLFLPEHQGRGHAGAALGQVLAWYARHGGSDHVLAETQAANQPSCRLLERAGFVETRRLNRFGEAQILHRRDVGPAG